MPGYPRAFRASAAVRFLLSPRAAEPLQELTGPVANLSRPLEGQPHPVRSVGKELVTYGNTDSLAGIDEQFGVCVRDQGIIFGGPDEHRRVRRVDMQLIRELASLLFARVMAAEEVGDRICERPGRVPVDEGPAEHGRDRR